MSDNHVRSAAELAIGDVVRTPSGRLGTVEKHYADGVIVRYHIRHGDVGKGDTVQLKAHWLVIERRAPRVVDHDKSISP
jgi:hypothetical protein